ncbi:MAG: DUF3307 domain-containing protein [Candidatus Omnitrophota bacterium]
MFLFLRLLLGHLIGDFPLQTDRIFLLKHKGLKGNIPHALLVTASLIALSWPYLSRPYLWYFIIFVGTAHYLQDLIKIKYSKLKYGFWFYLLDQAAHILTISLIFLTPLKNVGPIYNSAGWLAPYYNSNAFILYLIALILATYNGLHLIRNFRNSFFGCPGNYTPFEKWYGMLERAIIVSLFLYSIYYFLWLIPVVFLARPLIYKFAAKGLELGELFMSPCEVLFGWIVALLSGSLLLLCK